MKVLLTKPVAHLGLPGDVKEVKDGYARNYLIPQGLAVLSSDPMAGRIHAELGTARAQAEQAAKQAEASAASWEGKRVDLAVKANPDGTLFGAVTGRDIAESLGIDPKDVHFESTKVAGESTARIDLGFGVSVEIPVMIAAEGTKARSRR